MATNGVSTLFDRDRMNEARQILIGKLKFYSLYVPSCPKFISSLQTRVRKNGSLNMKIYRSPPLENDQDSLVKEE